MEEKAKYPVLTFILRFWKTNLFTLLIAGIAIIFYVFFVIEKKYTSNVSILPPSGNLTSGIGGQMGDLASLVGVNIQSNAIQSPDMYKEILLSRQLTEHLLFEEFEILNDQNILIKDKLINLLKIEAKSDHELLDASLKMFREKVIFINISTDCGIVYLTVTLNDPNLAAKVATRMVEILNNIVTTQVQLEYRQQLMYIQEHINVARDSIKISERDLQFFLEDVNVMSDPINLIREMALKRDLELYTAIYVELKKQLEIFTLKSMVTLAEVKILDKANVPYYKSRPKRVLLVISAGLLFLVIQISINSGILIFQNFRSDIIKNNDEN